MGPLRVGQRREIERHQGESAGRSSRVTRRSCNRQGRRAVVTHCVWKTINLDLALSIFGRGRTSCITVDRPIYRKVYAILRSAIFPFPPALFTAQIVGRVCGRAFSHLVIDISGGKDTRSCRLLGASSFGHDNFLGNGWIGSLPLACTIRRTPCRAAKRPKKTRFNLAA